jgi:hypothetical protein
LASLVSACGNGGGGKTELVGTTNPNRPAISDFRAAFGPGQRCPVLGLIGRTVNVAFEYTDADGDVRGGTLSFGASLVQVGREPRPPVERPIPSPGITIGGTTSGTVAVRVCVYFGGRQNVTLQVKVFDAAENPSNSLELEVPRPGSSPISPQDVGQDPEFVIG